MEQLLQQFNQRRSTLSDGRGSLPAPMGSAISNQVISPAAENTIHLPASLLAQQQQQQQQAYSFDASSAFGSTQSTVLAAQQWPYRTASVQPAGAGLLQTSIASWPNEFYAGQCTCVYAYVYICASFLQSVKHARC